MLCCCRRRRLATFTLTDKLRDVAEEMRLTDAELQRLFHLFCRIDTLNKGTVSKQELFDYIGLERNLFVDRIFDDLDADGDGSWSFTEWMSAMQRLNLLTHNSLMEYMFSMFDVGNTGYIVGDNLTMMMELIHGPKTMYPMAIATAIQLYDEKHDNKIDFVEFRSAQEQYPILMWPIFEFQIKIQVAVLGIAFWERIYVRVNPHLARRHDQDVVARLREAYSDWSASDRKLVGLLFPCIGGARRGVATVPEANLRKHELEKLKMQTAMGDKVNEMFDGLAVVTPGDHGDRPDSDEEIEELTDNEEFDVAMYMPRCATPSSYKKETIRIARTAGAGAGSH